MRQLMHLSRADRNIVTWCDVTEKIENIPRGFICKRSKVESLDYYDRLRKGGIYSLERRRCRNKAEGSSRVFHLPVLMLKIIQKQGMF